MQGYITCVLRIGLLNQPKKKRSKDWIFDWNRSEKQCTERIYLDCLHMFKTNLAFFRELFKQKPIQEANGVQEAAGSNPVTRTKTPKSLVISAFFLFFCSEKQHS